MSAAKLITLVIYLVLAGLALVQADTSVGIWSLRILLLIAAVHLIEVAVFFKLWREAGGSLPGHLLNVFLFGVIHVKEIKDAQAR